MTPDKLTAVLDTPYLSRDVLLELYDAWAAARDDARSDYLAWCAAPYGEKAAAYTTYLAGTDREDAAAATFLRARGPAAAIA